MDGVLLSLQVHHHYECTFLNIRFYLVLCLSNINLNYLSAPPLDQVILGMVGGRLAYQLMGWGACLRYLSPLMALPPANVTWSYSVNLICSNAVLLFSAGPY